MIIYFTPPLSFSGQDAPSLPSGPASLGGWRWELQRALTWQPQAGSAASPLRAVGGAWAGFGNSPAQTGISSPAREEMGGGGAGNRGGDPRSPRAGWIPWEEVRSCSPPGAPAPRLGFQPSLPPLRLSARQGAGESRRQLTHEGGRARSR